MNIILPLGGKGERFTKEGYTDPKPLVPILDKRMIEYVFDNVTISKDDCVFIIHNANLNRHRFAKFVREKYSHNIQFVEIGDTKGAVETLYLGITHILEHFSYNKKCLLMDCDTFYTENIVDIFRRSCDNMVFYTKNYETKPVYSYIELDDDNGIKNIKEKDKISDNANTGAYAFADIHELYKYSKHVLDNDITFNNEPYTSCVISEMLRDGVRFVGHELSENRVFSLGTPEAVRTYTDKTHAFLFDLDGTLVITDNIYIEVWNRILSKYNIVVDKDVYAKFIQGNNDKYVLTTLLRNIDISLKELSSLKDSLFIENIEKVQVIDGVYDMLFQIKESGHKACIVTNCNREVATAIANHIHIEDLVDFIVSSSDCKKGKPDKEPYEIAAGRYNVSSEKCIIFEDSNSGILSAKSMGPKKLVGITTIYSSAELRNHGVTTSIDNYSHVSIDDFLSEPSDGVDVVKALIRQNTTLENIQKIDVDSDKLKGGFIADVVAFSITTSDGKKHPCILKYENEDVNGLSDMANRLQLYQREYYFYTDVSMDVDVDVHVPKFHNLLVDKNDKTVGIVLENLMDKGYTVNVDLASVSIDVTMKIVDRMAKLHASFWGKPLQEKYPGLHTSTSDVFCPYFTEFIGDRMDAFRTRWSSILNEQQQRRCEDIYTHFSSIQKRFSTGSNLTFIHGDIKSPNIFYDISNGYEPWLIDWQHCAIGKGVQDLVFFVLESFEIENIVHTFKLMKSYYYSKLLEYGVTNYTFTEYENDVYDAICYIPFFTGVWFGTTPMDELIDKNFPYFLISKMFYLLDTIDRENPGRFVLEPNPH